MKTGGVFALGASVFKYWKYRVEKCVLRGVWEFYNDEIGKIEGQLFDERKANPLKGGDLKHQIHMEFANLSKTKKRIARFAEHALKKSFGSM